MATISCRSYGSRYVTVTLETKPSHLHSAFLVPLDKWSEIAHTYSPVQPYRPLAVDKKNFQLALSEWFISTSQTPISASTLPYQQVYVVEQDGEYHWATVDFAIQRKYTIAF